MALLDVRHITKTFPGVRALERVSLRLERGEVLALLGENGAGKSTLMKILGGVQRPDSGEIELDGKPVEIHTVNDAARLGIALIHQELNLADNLNIAENVFLGREPRRLGVVDRAAMEGATEQLLARVGLAADPRTQVRRLPIGQQQLVEIAKALATQARILILDEPTSSLAQEDTARLLQLIGELRGQGVSMIYISHRLGEVEQIADRATVLRDGRNSGELERGEIDRANMVRLMVGRDIHQFYHHREHIARAPALEVEGLQLAGKRAGGVPISFSVGAGEIVGLAGLIGAGRTELLEAIFGQTPALAGQIKVAGQTVKIHSPRDAIRAGLALVPEDRKQQGLVLEMAVQENIALPGLRRLALGGIVVRQNKVVALAREMIAQLGVRTPSARQPVQYLSGGNQQKVVLAKWLALKPRVLLLDEPTRGIDVVAKEEIYRLMEALAEAGIGVLVVSSELQEVLGISDRVLVMHEGRLSGEVAGAAMTEEQVMHLATGGRAA
jgi:ribose transport system ATP-binding protein